MGRYGLFLKPGNNVELAAVYRDWLSHVAEHLKQELLKQKFLHLDETHVQVLNEPGRKNISDSFM